MGNKIIIIAMIAVLCLYGCGVESPNQEAQEHSEASATDASATETLATDVSATDVLENVAAQTDFDVEKALEEAEIEASALQKKLQEDSSLTQADMNTISYEIYQVWDVVLNDLWNSLELTLDEATMDSLLQEQRAWITEKESEVKQAAEEVKGGSMAPLAANQRAAKLTRTRVYELASYLGFEEPDFE